jgi:hypothetical protein
MTFLRAMDDFIPGWKMNAECSTGIQSLRAAAVCTASRLAAGVSINYI